MRAAVLALALLAAAGAGAQDGSWREALHDPREILTQLREEIVHVPLLNASREERAFPLTATLFQPAGAGPFPVLVLNHGAAITRAERDAIGRYRLIPQVREWLRRGFAVLVPIRRGYGVSPGDIAESPGNCERPQLDHAGRESARDVLSALDYARTRPTLDASRIVLLGQSAGGFASLAAAGRSPRGLIAVLNFSGGRLGNGRDGLHCAVDAMAASVATYARATRVPVLWFYTENDRYFGPAASQAWFAAFQGAGGKGRYILHPPYGNDGHLLFYKPEAIPIWSAAVDDFFRDFGVAAGLVATPAR